MELSANGLRVMPKIKRVYAFIDWNSQLLGCGFDPKSDPLLAARAAFKHITKRIAQTLHRLNSDLLFRVHLRLYHGWRKGYEPSVNRKAVTNAISEIDFDALSVKPNVVFESEVGFGDCLISALPCRLHSNTGIHLPNTLRDRGSHGVEEKMVDTALAADLIVTAYEERDNWILVAAEDDDLIPPIFAAEAIMSGADSRVFLLSKRARSKNFLKLENISV